MIKSKFKQLTISEKLEKSLMGTNTVFVPTYSKNRLSNEYPKKCTTAEEEENI